MPLHRALMAVVVVAMLAGACGGEADGDSEGMTVVATTTVLGDVVANVVGDAATVEVLMPVGVDPHAFQPSAEQAASLTRADLVVANGLGLEEGLADVLEAAAGDGANVLEIGPLVDPLPFAADADLGGLDPHVWLDPVRMANAARIIGAALTEVDGSRDWESSAAAYAGKLLATDDTVASLLQVVPEQRRVIVTNHRAFGYFAERYGFRIVGTIIPGGSTMGEPSSAELAGLVRTIEVEGVPAIFTETTESSVLAEAVADELGRDVAVVELYTGSLGEPGSGADTLIGMLETNAQRIAEALR